MSQSPFRSRASVHRLSVLWRYARTASTVALVCSLLFAAAPHSFAQTFRGTILGTVTDPQGAFVVGATVTARNLDTGIERSTVTDDAGNYSLPELPIGRYEVKVQAAGFRAYSITDVRVEVASERRADAQLSVGSSSSDTVTITANAVQVEAIAEAAVLSNFEAEYGRNSGAIVNLVTKSGTNDIHGSAFEFLRDNKFDARNFYNTRPNPQTEFTNHQFGFAAGGPFVRNRTFWFTAYEGQREDVGLNSVARVPDPREIAALGGATNPVIAKLLQRNPWPAPNNPVPLFDPSPNLFVTAPATNNVDSFIAKLDHSFNEKNQLTGRYYFGTSDQSFPLAILAGNVLPGFNTVTPTTVHLVSLSYLKILSSQKVNEARFGYNRFRESFFPEDSDFDPRSIGLNNGITNARDFGLPFIRFRSDATFGGATIASIGSNIGNPRGRIDTNYQFIDNFSWKLTGHDLKFGYEFRRTFVDAFFDAGYRGRLTFDTFADFLAGNLSSSGSRAARGDSQRGTAQNSHAAYIQDSWRATRKLTLNAGLRYDFFGVISEENNLLSNFDRTRGLVLVGTNGLD